MPAIGPMRAGAVAIACLSISAICQGQAPPRGVAETVRSASIDAAAARIDALVERGLQQQNQAPNAIVDDATFVRRAYLQLVGRIPNLQEAETFLRDQRRDKRSQLVDQLLDSAGHVSSEANFWFDLLRVRSRLMRQTSGEPFAHWIKQSLAADKPYDQFVREMLTADGAAHERGNGATGFLLRDMNMPHDAMSNTLRVFLGTRVECAQCHNHPFDKWTQMQFYQMAAFFGGIRYRSEPTDVAQLQPLREAARSGEKGSQQAARRLLQTLGSGLGGSGTGVDQLPDDYKYDDARPRAKVHASTIFGAEIELHPVTAAPSGRRGQRQRQQASRQPEIGSRRTFADWLTSADNPRFSLTISNRIWQHVMGRGVIEPLDNLTDDTKASNPALMTFLSQLMVDLKFDLRQFERVLCHTQLFQRACSETDVAEGASYHFPGPLLRRMTAEQTWDSLLTLVFADLDQRIRPVDARAREVYDRFDAVNGASASELAAMLDEQKLRLSNPQQYQAMQREKQRLQAGERLQQQQQRQQQARPLLRQLQLARRQGDDATVARLQQQLQQLGVTLPGQRAQRGREGDLLRAADLVQPAPAGHLLRQFGQSDRETVDAANTAASVPQVLTLLNGFLDERLFAGASSLRANLEACTSPDAKVRTAFLTLLSRAPRADELAEWQPIVSREGDSGLRDLAWVLCNSNEFRFVR